MCWFIVTSVAIVFYADVEEYTKLTNLETLHAGKHLKMILDNML